MVCSLLPQSANKGGPSLRSVVNDERGVEDGGRAVHWLANPTTTAQNDEDDKNTKR